MCALWGHGTLVVGTGIVGYWGPMRSCASLLRGGNAMNTVTTLRLPFGHSYVSVQVPNSNLVGVFEPQRVEEWHDEAASVHEALAHPIGTPRLRDLARPGQKVVIVTSDLTRPCPSAKLLPPVLAELAAAGVAEHDIAVVVAVGLHRLMTSAELEATVGSDVFRRVRVINHDVADTVRLGLTSVGTPVEIFRPVVDADLRVCVGNVELHYFVGYSGGAKAIVPGCASEVTVTANHAMMLCPEARAGCCEGNPVRADLEEGAAMVGVDFILNVVVDAEHRIVHAVAGDVIAAHRKGCELLALRAKIAIPGLADIVLVSPGGYPKDMNLYQAQKALDNAAYAVRRGGAIVLVAECREGFGNSTFEDWITSGRSPQQLAERIQERFVLGGHKAAAIAKVAQNARIFLVSPSLADVPITGMERHSTAQAALDAAFRAADADAGVIVLPEGSSVLPQVPN